MKKHKICIVGDGLAGLISALIFNIDGLDIDATYLLNNANKPNPTKSKQSAMDAEHCRPPRSNAYNDDGK